MKFRFTSKVATLIVFGIFLVLPLDASAKQYKQSIQGKEVVVHSNPIPVVLHRLVPPQHGRHVTQREVANRKNPSTRNTAPKIKR